MRPDAPDPRAFSPPLSRSAPNDTGRPLSPLLIAVPPLSVRWRLLLWTLITAYVLLASAHAALAPTGYGGLQNAPDEAAHIAYVLVVSEGRMPTRERPDPTRPDPFPVYQTPDGVRPTYEWHQPPLYYWLDALLLQVQNERVLRALSILCGLTSLFFIYQTGRRLFPEEPGVAVLAVGLAALTPTHIAITSTVNNDALLEACFSGALLAMINALRSGWTLYRAGWLGLALGLAVLAKASGVLLLPVIALALFLLWREGETPLNLLRGAAWMMAIALIVCGWWLVRNQMLYHEPIPIHAFNEAFKGTAQAKDWIERLGGWKPYVLLVAKAVFSSFWIGFGTPRAARFGVPLYFPPQPYLLLALASIAASGGMIRLHFQRKRRFTPAQQHGIQLFFAAIGVVSLSFIAFLTHYFQAQGRYLFPVMLPISLLFALGWRAVFPTRYINLATGFLLLLLGASSIAFLNYIRP